LYGPLMRSSSSGHQCIGFCEYWALRARCEGAAGAAAGPLRLRALLALLAVAKAAPNDPGAAQHEPLPAAGARPSWAWVLMTGPVGQALCQAWAPNAESPNAAPRLQPAGSGAPADDAAPSPDPASEPAADPADGGAPGAHDWADEAHALCMTEAPDAAPEPRALWACARLQLAASLLRAWAQQPAMQVSWLIALWKVIAKAAAGLLLAQACSGAQPVRERERLPSMSAWWRRGVQARCWRACSRASWRAAWRTPGGSRRRSRHCSSFCLLSPP